jgi:hypothetical protein
MAASRVALLQAYRTFHGHQNDLIDSTEDVWNHSLIREDLARGRITIDQIDSETLDRICAGRYLRPARFMPDPLKEAQAADVLTKRLGFSYSTVYGDMGADTETEWADREANDKDLKMRGIVLQGDGMVMAPAPNQTPPQGDDNEIPPEDPPADPPADEPPPADSPRSMSSAELATAIGDSVATALRAAPAPIINLTVASQRRSVTVKDNADGSVTATTDDLVAEPA